MFVLLGSVIYWEEFFFPTNLIHCEAIESFEYKSKTIQLIKCNGEGYIKRTDVDWIMDKYINKKQSTTTWYCPGDSNPNSKCTEILK